MEISRILELTDTDVSVGIHQLLLKQYLGNVQFYISLTSSALKLNHWNPYNTSFQMKGHNLIHRRGTVGEWVKQDGTLTFPKLANGPLGRFKPIYF